MNTAVFLLIFVLKLCSGEESPQISPITVQDSFNEGTKFSAFCSVKVGSRPLFFQWLKNKNVVENEIDGIKIDTLEDVSILTIREVKATDSANYTCVVRNALGSDTSTVTLTVKVPLRWTKEPTDQRVKLGENVKIECEAFGTPKPTTKWIKQTGEKDIPIGEELKFNSITFQDKGSYVCIASNGIDEALRKIINIVVNDAPRLVSTTNRVYEAGADESILCATEKGSQPLSFSWMKNGYPMSKSSPNNFEIIDRSDSSFLKFKHIEIKNEGNYTCTATNEFGIDKIVISLFVKMAPKWTKEPQDVRVSLGASVSLECDAIGSPKPVFAWRKLSSKDEFQSKVLHLKSVTASDSGKYECIVTNKDGYSLRKTISVTVSVPAKFEETYALYHSNAGESIKLYCRAFGDQPLSITWIKENKKLDKRGGERFFQFDAEHNLTLTRSFELIEHVIDRGLSSELVIRNVKRSDGSVYKCLAENEFGNSEKIIKLVVMEVPGAPVNVRVRETWSRSASVVWTPPFDGNTPITKYTVQYWMHQSATRKLNEFTVDGIQTTALIKDLKPGQSYELTVVAENNVGRGEAADSVTLFTNQEEPSVSPIDITAESKGSSTIRVTWKAPPKDQWNGDLHGYYVGFKVDGNQQQPQPFSFRTVKASANADPSFKYEYFIRDLLKATTYNIVVKAFNGAGSGPQSHEMRVQTVDGDLPEGPVLSVMSSTRTSISLRWQPKHNEKSNIISYTIHYQRENDEWRQIPVLIAPPGTAVPTDGSKSVPDTMTYVLDNLDSGTRFNIYVTGLSSFGVGDPSNVIRTKTNGDRVMHSQSIENVDEIPYYFQPLFMIPIITAIVIVIIVLVITYVCVQRIKSQYNAPDGFSTLSSKHLAYNATTPRYSFDKTSKPLMSDPGNMYPCPYATLPMGAKVSDEITCQKPWERPLPNPKIANTQPMSSHIYDNPQ